MDTNVADNGKGGGGYVGLRPLLQGRNPSHPTICSGDVVPIAPDGPDSRGLPPKGGLLDDGATQMAIIR